jgi:hypothetical protein
MTRGIDYGKLMHRAMRGLIQSVLDGVRLNGLPGDHHFFITFDTTHPDVTIANWLSDRYPSEMTVVMQHWFDDLEVDDDGFVVTLNFGDAPERLRVPYDAILTFVDPSVEFGLRFDSHSTEDEDEDLDGTDDLPEPPPSGGPKRVGKPAAPQKDAEVVRLDSFRKP